MEKVCIFCSLLFSFLFFAFPTFENMKAPIVQVCYNRIFCICITEYMKPDTETYNWVIQAYTRAESYDR